MIHDFDFFWSFVSVLATYYIVHIYNHRIAREENYSCVCGKTKKRRWDDTQVSLLEDFLSKLSQIAKTSFSNNWVPTSGAVRELDPFFTSVSLFGLPSGGGNLLAIIKHFIGIEWSFCQTNFLPIKPCWWSSLLFWRRCVQQGRTGHLPQDETSLAAWLTITIHLARIFKNLNQ